MGFAGGRAGRQPRDRPTLELGATCSNRFALLDWRGCGDVSPLLLRELAFAVTRGPGEVDDLLVLQDADAAPAAPAEPTPDSAGSASSAASESGVGRVSEHPGGADPVAYLFIVGADGRVADLCGNGLLFVAHALAADTPGDPTEFVVASVRGLHRAVPGECGWRAELGAPWEHVRALERLNSHLPDAPEFALIDTGEPHVVLRGADLGIDDVLAAPAELLERLAQPYWRLSGLPGGVNVTFVEEVAHASSESGDLRVRTFERGVRRLTASCGTGAAAAAWARRREALASGAKLRVDARGGQHLITESGGLLTIEASSERQGPRALEELCDDPDVSAVTRRAISDIVHAHGALFERPTPQR